MPKIMITSYHSLRFLILLILSLLMRAQMKNGLNKILMIVNLELFKQAFISIFEKKVRLLMIILAELITSLDFMCLIQNIRNKIILTLVLSSSSMCRSVYLYLYDHRIPMFLKLFTDSLLPHTLVSDTYLFALQSLYLHTPSIVSTQSHSL